jgi:hypothetical protein
VKYHFLYLVKIEWKWSKIYWLRKNNWNKENDKFIEKWNNIFVVIWFKKKVINKWKYQMIYLVKMFRQWSEWSDYAQTFQWMFSMFRICSDSVQNFQTMFRLCSVNVENVQNMFRIFSQCSECSESVQNVQNLFRLFQNF